MFVRVCVCECVSEFWGMLAWCVGVCVRERERERVSKCAFACVCMCMTPKVETACVY